MKYVYILVEDTNGFYFEQTLVSITSLKYVTPTANVTLLVDDRTDLNASDKVALIKKMCNEYIVKKFDDSITSVARSRFLKTSMRFLIEGDFLYVDSDTVWASPVEESDFTQDVMGVLDGHCLLNQHPLIKGIKKDFERVCLDPMVEKYVNGGVLFVKDSSVAREFFSVWQKKWSETSTTGCFIDMPSLNYAFKTVFPNGNFLLSGEYNCQISRSWRFFPKAKIVHFFTGWMFEYGEKPYLFQRVSFWEKIRRDGLDSGSLMNIKNPLCAFDGIVALKDLVDTELQRTATYGLLRDLFEKKKQGKKSKFDLIEKIVLLFAQKNK
ncbi:MAG: hypothetical protein MJY82_00955 [Fibrobacter sp.]|nr:hypothetical protein [Fibrobacter sp.]